MTAKRYVGIDIHKRHAVVAAVNVQQEMVLSPEKLSIHRLEEWAQQHLWKTDEIALEATTNAWEVHDLLLPLVGSVSVANSHQLKMISASASKTDKHDALVLAKLLAARMLPAIWVPPQHVRDLRALTRHRTLLVEERSTAKNRLHALLHQHNIKLPEGLPFASANEGWWANLPLAAIEQLQVRHFWQTIHHLNEQIAETETLIAQLSASSAWSEQMTFIMQLPGVGLYTGMTILAAIGDIHRFPTPQQLVGYAGLGARVHSSGDTHRTGKISKQGRTELRRALIASAWVAVRWSDYWKALYDPLARRIGKLKAITAIARKMLGVIWHVLSKREVDRHSDPQAIARSFMTWASSHHLARSQGVHRLQFVKQRLCLLGLHDKIHSFRANGRTHFLAAAT